jgi:hypothetical protein
MFLHKPQEFMLMVTIKIIYILMIYFQNVLAEKDNMLWAKLPAKPILKNLQELG